jgi:hypothetical protein
MSIEINFTNRETYITWRANWRAAYKELSAEIRQGKLALSNAFRSNDPKAGGIQSELSFNRKMAARMMETRMEAKELVKVQREQHFAEQKAA